MPIGRKTLGLVTVTTGGTPEAVTADTNIWVHSVFIQANPGNTNYVWVGESGMNRTTRAGVHAVLAAPTGTEPHTAVPSHQFTIVEAPRAFQLSEVYLDVGADGEGAIVSYLEAQEQQPAGFH